MVFSFWRVALGCLICSAALAQSNPIKITSFARFDLSGSPAVGGLDGGALLSGDGTVGRQTWRPAAEQPRTYTIQVAVTHFAWGKTAFRFVPANSGTVTLTLMGPWEPSTSGPIYRQEVLWDDLSADATDLRNGSFESTSGSLPVSWSRPHGDAQLDTGPVPPVDGIRYARTWHDGPFSQTLTVTGGVPVTLHFHVRAQTPPSYEDMPRTLDPDTAAHRAARRFMRGVNLGNYLEAPPGQDWGARYDSLDFARIRAEGFDHVRLPIAWHHYTGPAPGYTLGSTIFERADFLVDQALAQGLGVIVNIHHFDAFTSDPAGQTEKFYALWRQIANHYAQHPTTVAFELLNEPRGAATTTVINPIFAEAIRQIRQTNPNRTILVGPGNWNSIHELVNLRLPEEDDNLIVTVHSYDPFLFTHQGASWTGQDTATRGLVFPGPPATPLTPAAGVAQWVIDWIAAYNTLPEEVNPASPIAFQARLQQARNWSDYYGRPIHVGEFGAYEVADAVSRARFYHEIRSAMDALGLGWAMWDWKAGFHYWNNATGRPAPGLPEAMFPAPELRSRTPGELELDGAVAKTYRIDRASVLELPASWTPVSTQTLAEPRLFFADPAATAQAFYRGVWVPLPEPQE
jgi:endoglucanase